MGSPKLLIVTTVPVTLERFLLPFAARFRAKGWRVDAMAHGVSESLPCCQAFDRVWEVDWTRWVWDPSNLLKAPRQVRQVVLREGYDLVHVHTPVAAFVSRFALRSLRPPRKMGVIYTAHGFHFSSEKPFWLNGFYLGLEKMAGRWTDVLVVMNEEDERAARRFRILPPDRILMSPGIGIDLERYQKDKVGVSEVAGFRQGLGIGPQQRIFLLIGELISRKRHEDALRALVRLDRPEVHLALAGDGPLEAGIKALASGMGLTDRVHFLGVRSDIPVLLAACSGLLLTSSVEGLPLSIMEAMAMEVPVIASDIKGNRDLLREGAGWLVPVGDVDAIARAMADVLDYPDKARSRVRTAQDLVKTRDVNLVLDLYEGLYDKALKGWPG